MAGHFRDEIWRGDQHASDMPSPITPSSDVDRMGLARKSVGDSSRRPGMSLNEEMIARQMGEGAAEWERIKDVDLNPPEMTAMTSPQVTERQQSVEKLEPRKEPKRDKAPDLFEDPQKFSSRTEVGSAMFDWQQIESGSDNEGPMNKFSRTREATASTKQNDLKDNNSRNSTKDAESSIAGHLQRHRKTMRRPTNTFQSRHERSKVQLELPSKQLQIPEQQKRIDPELPSLDDRQVAIVKDITRYESDIKNIRENITMIDELINEKNINHEESPKVKGLRGVIENLERKRVGLVKDVADANHATSKDLKTSSEFMQLDAVTRLVEAKMQEKYKLDKQHKQSGPMIDLFERKVELSDQLDVAESKKRAKEAELQRITGHSQQASSNTENRPHVEVPAIDQELVGGSTTPFSDKPLTTNTRRPENHEKLTQPPKPEAARLAALDEFFKEPDPLPRSVREAWLRDL